MRWTGAQIDEAFGPKDTVKDALRRRASAQRGAVRAFAERIGAVESPPRLVLGVGVSEG